MSDSSDRKRIHQALDATLSGLHGDPWLHQRLLTRAREGDPPMKKRYTLGLVLALILVLLTATAVAMLTGKAVVEQSAVPLAQQNDQGPIRTDAYSPDELKELIRVATENGITLDESTGIMKALKNGESYWEEEAIMEICREVFGGLFYEWSIDEKHWYQEMMIRIGYADHNPYLLPGPEDMTLDEARAYAVEMLQADYGDLPLANPQIYRVEESFSGEEARDGSLTNVLWSFSYSAMDFENPTLSIQFDREGNVLETRCVPQDWTNFEVHRLVDAMDRVYGHPMGNPNNWDPAIWNQFASMLPQADRSNWTMEYEAYAQSQYPLPSEGDLDRQEAIEQAMETLKLDCSEETTAVLLSADTQRIWKVTLAFLDSTGKLLRQSVELDARTGALLEQRLWDDDTRFWARYVLFTTYDTLTAHLMRQEEAISLAQKALWEALKDPTIPFEDPACYQADCYYLEHAQRFNVTFRTQSLQYGTCHATVSAETGQVTITSASAPGVDGDTLYERYRQLYGAGTGWDQALWQQFDADMAELHPTTFEGKLLQATRHPDPSTVKLSREEAETLALLDANDPLVSAFAAVLIDAQPHPIWKLRLTYAGPGNPLYEIDAMTGEILLRSSFKSDNDAFDPSIRQWVLEGDFIPAANAHFGLAHMAAVGVSRRYGDMSLDDPMLPLLDDTLYTVATQDLQVIFTPLTETLPGYTVTFDSSGMIQEIVQIPAVNPEAVSSLLNG